MVGHHRKGRQVIYRYAKCIVQRCRIVNIQDNHTIRTGSFQQLGDVPCVDRIAQLRAPVFAGIGKVRNDRYALACAGVPQSVEQEQKSNEAFCD